MEYSDIDSSKDIAFYIYRFFQETLRAYGKCAKLKIDQSGTGGTGAFTVWAGTKYQREIDKIKVTNDDDLRALKMDCLVNMTGIDVTLTE